MEEKIKHHFEEIDKIFRGEARIPTNAICFFEENLKFYNNYCHSLMSEPENKGENINYVLFTHFLAQSRVYHELVGERETQCYANYRTMKVNEISRRAKYSNKVKESIEKELGNVLYELLKNTIGKLERYGFMQEFYKRERDSLARLGLTEIMPVDSTGIRNQILSEVDFKLARSKPEQLAINLFWINKYWKVFENSKLSLWLVDTHQQTGNQKDTISDDEKYLALEREKVLDYVQERTAANMGGMTFEDFILFLYAKRGNLPSTPRLERVSQELEKMKPQLQEYYEIEEAYNKRFETTPIVGGQLLNDCLYNLYLLKEKKNVQVIKDILTTQLVESLLIDRAEPSSRYGSWGLVKDEKMKGEQAQILCFDMPGFMKPLQVHVPNRLVEANKDKIPVYHGIYARHEEGMERAYATNFLFRLNNEQAKKLKQKMKIRREANKKHPQKSEEPIIKMLEYMSAVANGEMGKLPEIAQRGNGEGR